MKNKLLSLMATFVVTCQIAIGSYRFSQANSVEIDNDLFNVGDTAMIKEPSLKNSLDIGNKIKKGDYVTIKLGYIGLKKTYEFDEFKGFVKLVKPNVPIEIECEDAIYLMRQANCSVLLKDTTLKNIVSYLVDQTNAKWAGKYKVELDPNIPDIKFSKYRISNVNAASVLQELKEKYKLVAYFRDFTLHVQLPYFEFIGKTNGDVKYSLAWNVIKSDLAYKDGRETNIRLKAIAIKKDNKRINVEVGDPNGEIRTKIYYNISDKETLERVAQNDLGSFKVDALEGTITTFLIPFVRPNFAASIEDPDYNSRTGEYVVSKVKTTFTVSGGIRRIVTPGRRIA
jgi:hypothetical protein